MLIFCLIHSTAWAENRIRVSAAADVIADYQRFLNNTDPLQVKNFAGHSSRRDVVELVLLQQALAMGGFNEPIEFVPDTTYRRVLRQITEGVLISSATSKWLADLVEMDQQLHISSALIAKGEFSAGLYTLAENHSILNSTPEELKALRAISTPQWRADTRALTESGFEHIVYGSNWESMVKMLAANRGDILLMPFSNTTDLSASAYGFSLKPVMNKRVAFSDSRHWIVSKAHPKGDTYFAALQTGIKKLREIGRIRQAYEQCGFFNAATSQWPVLNSPVMQH